MIDETLELTLDEVEYIIAFIRSHEWSDIPEPLKSKILPKLENFHVSFFARKCPLSVSECIEKAIQDYKKNMS